MHQKAYSAPMMKFTKQTTLFFFCLFFVQTIFAQTYNITGKILDKKDNTSLIGVTVLLINTSDTNTKTGTVTDANGAFEIDNVKPGQYLFKSIYIGYQNLSRTITVTNSNFDLGPLKMETGTNTLKDVVIEAKQIRAQQMGDTSQFNADAYKTHPDATAEDLLTKMPGVTSDNSGVKVNGEAVQQVYVDGKPFFGTDPTLALRNLPSEVIDKIQVFDKLSDQSQFTGFDDGNSQKTMNIVTRKNKSNGEFGRFFAGYGTDDTYLAGGNLNIFEGDRRISILELSNNINQQNFSSQDILGITGGNQNRGGMGMGGSSRGSFGGGSYGGSSANNFLVGQQGGITTTNSAGINYSDNWGKKIKVSGSYFFNSTNNNNNTFLTRSYNTNPVLDSNILYSENDISSTKNLNHRFNFRFEYTIDSFNSLIITPSFSQQENYGLSASYDTSRLLKNDAPYSISSSTTPANSWGYNFSDNVLLQHKFHKKGRTISLNLGNSLNEKTGDGQLNSTLINTTTTYQNQNYRLYNNGYTLSSSLNYTEPIGKKSQLMFNYTPSYTKSSSDKETDSMNVATKFYDFDSLYSNKYNSTYIIQRCGLSYRLGDKKLNFMLGANLQSATLRGTQIFPDAYTTNRVFTDVLPSAFFNYRFADGRNLRIMYRTNITAPAITQLQNVVDISNPQLLKTGNPDLKQDYEQTLIVRYGLTKPTKEHNFFLFMYANYINDYIGNQTLIPYRADSTFAPGIIIKKNNQLSLPVNLNGYFNTKAFVTYALPLELIKSNLNLNSGLNYTHSPGLVNNLSNSSDNTAPSAGIVVSSNISEKVDFTFAYTATYNIVNNSFQTQSNNNYYNHNLSFKINYIFLKNFVFNTSMTNSYYSTFTSNSGTENILLWNAYLGYKFLKHNALEARITANDILNQNKSITRTVTAEYVENDITQVLKQYFMFSLTYTLRNFKAGASIPDTDTKDNREMYRNMFRGGANWGH